MDKNELLTRFSGLLKGLIIYKEEIAKLEELMIKYHFETNKIYLRENCFERYHFCFGPIG